MKGISPAAYHLLIRFRWPGNVRELENAIERAVLVAKAQRRSSRRSAGVDSRRGGREPEFSVPPHHTLAEIERMAILQTLQRTNWNKQEAAQHPRPLPSDPLQQDAQARHQRPAACPPLW